jgi:hypothetical protein
MADAGTRGCEVRGGDPDILRITLRRQDAVQRELVADRALWFKGLIACSESDGQQQE